MRFLSGFLTLAAAAALMAASAPQTARADVLYIGDAGDNTVKRFDAATATLDTGFSPSGLLGPNGMVIDGDNRLLVVNQNVNTHLSGEILAFKTDATGTSLGPVIAQSDHNAPYVPRGIVLGASGANLFVGNFSTAQGKSHGSLLQFELDNGALISDDPAKGFKNHDFHPRGIVFGPDHMLYVASPMDLQTGLGGAVLRFNADGTFADVFVNDENDAGAFGHLNRPEALVFGPDGNLYVSSFRAAPGDVDGFRIYNPSGGFVKEINYYDPTAVPAQTRVSAQAILFGPDGKLFAPLLQTGEVRAYDVTNGSYTTFIAAGGPLINPFYMTFGLTNFSTLAYGGTDGGAAVPEPASFVLACFGVLGLVACAGNARKR